MAQVLGAPVAVGGAGSGPGGGVGREFSFPSQATEMGGPEIQPLIGGSGGGGGACSLPTPNCGRVNGGGGGGAILIATSATLDLANGAINANAAVFAGGGGGAIRLLATDLKGAGNLTALNGDSPAAGGRIRLEFARSNTYSGPTSSAPSLGRATTVFPPNMPTLQIVSIGGIALPAQPLAAANIPDIDLPTNFTNPVTVVVEATHVPIGANGAMVVVTAKPQYGAGFQVTSAPTPFSLVNGKLQAVVALTLPSTGVGIISAQINSVVPVP